MDKAIEVIKELNKLADAKCAALLSRYFKTGKGQYSQGDIFLGIKVPRQREIVKKYKDLDLLEVARLLKSKIHEQRLVALLILADQFKKADNKEKKEIFNLYLKNTKYINNWDLVDLSSPNIVGEYLLDKKRDILYKLAQSQNLWQKRIAIMACFAFIRNFEYSDCLKISRLLLKDKHDLIHKAAGWMLREIGKKDLKKEEEFLDKYFKIMPRTMLRYAIEKFSQAKRKKYLKK